jgi:hypothetical protein
MASGWSPKPVLRVQVSALPLLECGGRCLHAALTLLELRLRFKAKAALKQRAPQSKFGEVAEWIKAALC